MIETYVAKDLLWDRKIQADFFCNLMKSRYKDTQSLFLLQYTIAETLTDSLCDQRETVKLQDLHKQNYQTDAASDIVTNRYSNQVE